jgi:hypothetical protein
MEVFPTFEKFILGHKIYIGGNNTIDVCAKNIIIFKLLSGILKYIGDALYVPKLA